MFIFKNVLSSDYSSTSPWFKACSDSTIQKSKIFIHLSSHQSIYIHTSVYPFIHLDGLFHQFHGVRVTFVGVAWEEGGVVYSLI